MKRILLCIAYDGTEYAGFQLQKNALTIEEAVNKALLALTGESLAISGASRTDAGVHALGNLAVFDTESRIPPEKFCYALNERLPEDIRIQWSKEVEAGFHPRKMKSQKTYEYRILNRPVSEPNIRRNTLHYHYPLDAEAMNEAAACFLGEHDFTSFASIHSTAKTRVRTIYESFLKKEGELLTFHVKGSGFLYNMVRIMAGTLLEVGSGKRKSSDIPAILEARDRQLAGPTAPAHALTLISIEPETQEPGVSLQ